MSISEKRMTDEQFLGHIRMQDGTNYINPEDWFASLITVYDSIPEEREIENEPIVENN